MIRVVAADDHAMFVRAITTLLAGEPDIEVIAAVGTGKEAVRAALQHRPDVVLMDLHMPDLDGVEATRLLAGAAPHIGVLVLTMFDDDDWIAAALRAGARGYLLKGARQEEVARAIRSVCRPRWTWSSRGSCPSSQRRAEDHCAFVPPATVPACVAAFDKSPARSLAEHLVAPHELEHIFDHVQLCTNQPGNEHRPGSPHIDGMGHGPERPETFTMLAGIYLGDETEPEQGNLYVWPGSHDERWLDEGDGAFHDTIVGRPMVEVPLSVDGRRDGVEGGWGDRGSPAGVVLGLVDWLVGVEVLGTRTWASCRRACRRRSRTTR